MSGEVIFYCPCNGTKHYFNETFIGQVSLYELGSGARRTMANGVNGPYLKMPYNAFDFLFETSMPTTLTIEWWQRNISDYGCIMMPSAQSDAKKLQIQVSAYDEKFTNIRFENRNGDLNIPLNNILNNQWTHVAYTQDYVNSRVYAHVNGVFKNSASTNVNEYAWNLFCIGGKSSSTSFASEFFGGDIDEVIITNGAKYPFGQDFIPSTEAPSLTGLSQGGQEEPAEQYEYISNITLSGTNRLIKSKVVEETNKSSNIKEWVGTKQEYDSILLKDNYTKYIITDDGGEGFSVDNALSTTSANPVENRVITNAIQNMAVAKTRIVGEIIESTIPLTNAGLHLLDGSIIIGNGVYSEFVTYMAGLVNTHPEIFDTESNWQQSVADYGVCGKFVYDSVNNTVRLPKKSSTERHLVKSTVSGTNWCDVYSDGWCEQGGRFESNDDSSTTVSFLQEFLDTNYTLVGLSYGNLGNDPYVNGWKAITLNTSSAVIRNNTNGTNSFMWQACGYIDVSDLEQETVYPYIVISNSTKTEIEADIDEIATDLNGKADVDLTNCTKPHIVETYVNGTSWYRVWSDGWCEQGGVTSSITGNTNSVELLKTFADTSFTVQLTPVFNSAKTYTPAYDITSASTINIGVYTDSTAICWRAEGYLAS